MRRFFYNVVNPFIAIFLAVFVGIGFISSLFAKLSIAAWSVIFVVSFFICAILFGVKRPDFSISPDDADPAGSWTTRDRLIGYLPFLIFVPGYLIVFSNTYYEMVFEGILHTSFTSQILAGVTPPENPFLPGFPPNYYWLYHSLLATAANISHLAPPLLASLLNLIALFCIFAWVKQLIRVLGYGHLHPLLLNLLAIFVVFGTNLFGIIHAVDDIFVRGIGKLDDTDMILFGDQIRTLWFKYLAFTSFPLALAYYAAGIFAAVQLARGRIRSSSIVLLMFSIAGGIAFSLGTGMFMLVTLLPALFLSSIFDAVRELKSLTLSSLWATALTGYRAIETKIAKWNWVLLTLLGIVTAYLSVGYYRSATESYQVTGSFSLTDVANLMMLISAFYPLLPFFIWGCIRAVRDQNRLMIFTASGAILGCGVAYVSVLRGDNQYKFVYLSSFLICLTIVPILCQLINNAQRSRFQKGIAISVLVLVLVNLGYADLVRIKNAVEFQQGKIYTSVNILLINYDGRFLNSGREIYQDVYLWLRDTTDARTIIVMPVDQSALLASVSGRLPYVGRRLFSFVKGLPEYTERADRVKVFYAPETILDERKNLITQFVELDPTRPVVILIPHDSKIPPDHLTALNMQLLFRGENGDLYAP